MKRHYNPNAAISTPGACDICNFSMTSPRLRNGIVCILHLMIKPLKTTSACESFLRCEEKSSFNEMPNSSNEDSLEEDKISMACQCIKTIKLPLGIALSLSIFVFTFFEVHSGYQTNKQISSFIISAGAGMFFMVMTALNYLSQTNGTRLQRLAKAATIAIAEATLFVALVWFLAMNTIVDRTFV
jgi:hypothetical protein